MCMNVTVGCCIFRPAFGCCAPKTLVKICNFNVCYGKKLKKSKKFAAKYSKKHVFLSLHQNAGFWCNGPVRDRSLCLQADIGTSGRIIDDDALSSCWTGDDAVVVGSYSSRSVVTRG